MELFDEAVVFATQKHSGQRRKGSDAPYILHPLEAAAIVGTMTDDQETLAAAVLHDTVEDTDTTIEEIRGKFGKRVALLVLTETEDKRPGVPEEQTWQIRKQETLAILEMTKDDAVRMMWLGDKLSNMRSFFQLHLREGDAMWNRFNQKDPSMQLWYYNTLISYLEPLSRFDAYKELKMLTSAVFYTTQEAELSHDIVDFFALGQGKY